MSKIAKGLLNSTCSFLTRILNQVQIVMCDLETKRMYKIHKETDKNLKKAIHREYNQYKSELKKYGLKAVKRDFYVFRKYFEEKGNKPSLIVPSYVTFNYLTPVLNPISTKAYFEDKNMFDKILPASFMPRTLARKINNQWLDINYEPIMKGSLEKFDQCKKIIVKPTQDTSSGKGIGVYELKKGNWENIEDRTILNKENINKIWGDRDLIIQEYLNQSDYLNQFCNSAINTLRVVIYNSPVDNNTYLIWAGLKVALQGAIVDNAHAGGIVFGIGPDGTLADYGADQFGNVYREFNGIDFSENKYELPNYNKIIELCKEAMKYLYPNRFVSFDVAIDENNNPKIIEYNLRAYSGWYCQFAGDPMFGNKTEEILSYITQNSRQGKKFFYFLS